MNKPNTVPEAKLLVLIKRGSEKKLGALGQKMREQPFQVVRVILSGLIVASWVYGLSFGAWSFLLKTKTTAPTVLMEKTAPVAGPGAKTLDLSALAKRNLFKPLVEERMGPTQEFVKQQQDEIKKQQKEENLKRLQDRASQLVIIGMIPGNSLQAILEDKQTQSTRYVTAGQMIDEFLVESVKKDGIILKYEEVKVQLNYN